MLPKFKAPAETTFVDECRHRFNVACQARKITPFHVDKRKYEAEAWAEIDAYLDWLEIEKL